MFLLYIPGFFVLVMIWVFMGGYSRKKRKRIAILNRDINVCFELLAEELSMTATTHLTSSSELQIDFPEINGNYRGLPVTIAGFTRGSFGGKSLWTEVVIRVKNPGGVFFIISRARKYSSSGTLVNKDSLGISFEDFPGHEKIVIRANDHRFIRSLADSGVITSIFHIMLETNLRPSFRFHDNTIRYSELVSSKDENSIGRLATVTRMLGEIAAKATDWQPGLSGFLS